MFRIKNLTKIFYGGEEVRALNDVSFEINDGELVAIIGKSGSGKSTLLNIMGLLDSASEGGYYINEKKASSLPEEEKARLRNMEIGIVLQDFALVERYTVSQNIAIPLIYSKKNLNKEKSIRDILNLVGLSEKKDTPSYKLSGGQKQRVAIARAVINNPSLILADEPTGALDSKTSEEIMELFLKLNKEGKTIVIVTHDKQIAQKCNRIIELSDGKIVSDTDLTR
ncbi:MAG: ABC transporter ATP-binding protein [Ruminiclostridium sp.]|nr:ABC transporter ATP-binding protein [Ruminiclostridium sp.]